jgi:ATP-dependent helicase/nuclease subunit B
LNEQIKNESYRPFLIEHEISTGIALDNARSLMLNGRVDRIDIARENGIERVKIIDYKSGSGKFSAEEALKGVQLQLMLYMNAFLKTKKNFEAGGVFYFPIDDPIINADNILDDAEREKNLLKCFKMSGLEADESFADFGREVEKKVKELGARIFDGEIAAKPYTRGQKSPCKYCNYTGVCGRGVGRASDFEGLS